MEAAIIGESRWRRWFEDRTIHRSARVVSRLQTLGRRIFPGRRSGPQGSRRRPGSAWRGGPQRRWWADSRWVKRVRGERGQTLKGARASLLRSRGRGSNQQKASWVRVSCGAKPTIASLDPGRTGFLESSEERSVLPRPATEDVRGLVRPVRLPQPMGAGGQQPLRSQPLTRGVDSMLRRPGKAEAITVKPRAIRSACGQLREMLIRHPETDHVRWMPRWRCARPVEARLGWKAEQGKCQPGPPQAGK